MFEYKMNLEWTVYLFFFFSFIILCSKGLLAICFTCQLCSLSCSLVKTNQGSLISSTGNNASYPKPWTCSFLLKLFKIISDVTLAILVKKYPMALYKLHNFYPIRFTLVRAYIWIIFRSTRFGIGFKLFASFTPVKNRLYPDGQNLG